MRRRTDDVMQGQEAAPPVLPYAPEDIIRVLEPMTTDARRARLQQVLGQRLDSVTVVVDALYDPHNGAAILRTCDAFGVQRLHAIERDVPFAAARSVARGSQKWVDVVHHDHIDTCVRRLMDAQFTLVATHPEGDLLPADLVRIPRVALVLGNERDGIAPALRAACHSAVRVPMVGFVESLNVSVTTAILLHAATTGRSGDLHPEERVALYARGLMLSVQRSEERLAALLGDPIVPIATTGLAEPAVPNT